MKATFRFLVLPFLLFLTVESLTCRRCWGQEERQKALIVKAAVGGAGLLETWARRLQSDDEGISVIIIGSTEEKAFEALLSKEASLALLLGRITKEQQARAAEKGLDLAGSFVGRTGFAVITHRNNRVSTLTLAQVRSLFTGRFKRWSAVGGTDEPVKVFLKRPSISPVTKLFRQDMLLWSPYVSEAVIVNSFMSVIRRCAQSQDMAIAFVPFSLLMSATAGRLVKVLALKKTDDSAPVLPSDDTIKDLSYPAAGIPLYLYWDKRTLDNRIEKFADYCVVQAGSTDGS
jgi:phosphate transport system substrate-binding protein